MTDAVVFWLAFAAAIGSGLVAGIFYAFSSFVMGALGRIPPEHGVNAMQAINVVVLNRSFFLVFFGTALLSLALIAGAVLWWGDWRGKLLLAGSLLYLVGCIGVTMRLNVPLNNELAAVNAGTPAAAPVWTRYLDRWTVWNTVRTLASAAAMAVFVAAIVR